MGSRGCPLPPEGLGWGAAKSPCGGGAAVGPAVAWCSGSAVIVTGAINTAASDAVHGVHESLAARWVADFAEGPESA